MNDGAIPSRTLCFTKPKRRKRDAGIECQRNIPITVLHRALQRHREKELIVYLVLATFQDMRGRWFRLRKDVQSALGLPSRTRATYLRRLENSGCIKLRRAPGECYKVSVLPWSAWLAREREDDKTSTYGAGQGTI
jgi:hypothetical protein